MRGRLGAENSHVVTEQAVQAGRVDGLMRIADHLPPGVHTRVGAPGDPQRERPAVAAHGAENRVQRALQLRFDRAQARLAHPARESAPVVLERELAHHRPALRFRPWRQTSSMKTISVESLRRGPSLRMRV